MTSDHPALSGLDAVDWSSLEHAYGPATDVPEVLRTLVGDDGEQAEDALYELYSNVWHQGSVYPATVEAVPFLVEIAAARAAGPRTADVLRLLGSMAESTDPRGIEDRDAVRAAVAAGTDALVPLLDDPEEKTRAAVLYPLMCVAAQTAADFADGIIADPSSGVLLRVTSALAWVHAGRAADERVLAAALAPIPEESVEVFDAFVAELAAGEGPQAAIGLVTRALAEAARPGRYLFTVRRLINEYGSAADVLAEPMTRLLDHPGLERHVVSLLELMGPSAATSVARDRLVELTRVEDEPFLADEALACLARWQDPIVPSLLARALTDRPQTLDAVAELVLPFDADLLAAIRSRLIDICDGNGTADALAENPFTALQDRNEPRRLAEILASWTAHAEPAVPELIRLLTKRPVPAARALVAIGPPSPEIVAALRQVVNEPGEDDVVYARVEVARAIRTLTGDAAPLLDAAQFGLTYSSKSPDDRGTAASAAVELPEHADLLVPLLLDVLEAIPLPTPSLPAHQARLQLGRTLWQLTGDPEYAIDVLRGTFELVGESLTGWTITRAVELAAEIGPAAHELVPSLEAALQDPIAQPAAERALAVIREDMKAN
ncbi:MAG TPA: hypothetical protein VL551_08795 [Actinospica sp.]|jgi:hypothetical protein|nr:hypothetical protein [Actinospica sp.]